MSKRTAIRDLSCASIEVKPVDADWSEGYGEKWDFVDADRCDKCGKIVVGCDENTRHRYVDEESTCDGYVSLSAPMMSYWYPVEIDDTGEAAKALVDLPLCVVTVDGQTGLALTGGGMDLSWEICAAYIALGHLPPLHFCDVPDMASRWTPAKARTVAACVRSCNIAAGWATDRAKRVRRTAKSMRERSAREQTRKAG